MVAVSGKLMLLIGLGVVIVVGAALGIYFGVRHHKDSNTVDDSKESSGNTSDGNIPDGSVPDGGVPDGNGSSGSDPNGNGSGDGSGSEDSPIPTTTKEKTIVDRLGDPKDAEYEFNFFHIADAGATASFYTGDSSCCDVYHEVPDKNSRQYKMDMYSQVSVSALMDHTAQESKPEFIINGGDNFYWNGIYGNEEQGARFEDTFTKKYNQPSLIDVPWYSVLGNHDYGGEGFICGKTEDSPEECSSTSAMLAALKDKYVQQMPADITRWKMAPTSQVASDINGAPDFFHMNSKTVNNVTVEVYHVDTGYAMVHGAPETCCQCFGYGSKDGNDPKEVCKHPADKRGGAYCAGGDTGMYDACIDWFDTVSENSLNSLKKALEDSTADFKIVNSHYAPQLHFSDIQFKDWYKVMEDGGVQLMVAGHTHAMFHDFVDSINTHIIVDGVGGGIQSQSATKPAPNSGAESIWMARGNPYGFVNLAASKNWLKVEFVTFASDQQFTPNPQVTTSEVIRSYYIPVTGELGIDAMAQQS